MKRNGLGRTTPDGQLKVPGNYPGLLVVPGGVAGQLQDLGGKIFHHSGHVDWCASTNSLGIVTFPNNVENMTS